MGHGYDLAEGRALCGALTAIMTGAAYAASAEMARELGAFPGYARNAERDAAGDPQPPPRRRGAPRRLRGPQRAAGGARPRELPRPRRSSTSRKAVWDEALDLGQAHGFRNAQTTVIAPTGTIGLVMDCDTTGIEPDFALVKFKKLAGGGYFKIINQVGARGRCANLGYARGGDRRDRRPRRRPRHARRRAGDQPDRARRPRLRRRGDRQGRGGAAGGLRHPLRLQPVDARRGVLHASVLGIPAEKLARPGLRPAAPPRLHAGRRSRRRTPTSAAR